jgi:hypothetical protein
MIECILWGFLLCKPIHAYDHPRLVRHCDRYQLTEMAIPIPTGPILGATRTDTFVELAPTAVCMRVTKELR